MQDYGAVCDISVLNKRSSVQIARKLFLGRGLYLPNSTYSWVSHNKFIQVRNRSVGYSLLKQLVETREIYPVSIPEIYNELARRIMFEVDHNIPLTDLRTFFLSTHLRLPLLTFDEKVTERLSENIQTHLLWKIKTHANWLTIREISEFYREFLFETGSRLNQEMDEELSFVNTLKGIKDERKEKFQKISKSIQKISQNQSNPGNLEFQCLAWDITSTIQDYSHQHILEPESIRELCERSLLLVAKPV
ncbi:MAG: hypothetical protein KGY45_01475 [Hadesarchaea archaeon]|nr:hypothetical protein [Hadesarchaea archaeon]